MTPVDYILSQPWAMLPENVAQMVAVAERTTVDSLEAVSAKLGKPLENARAVKVRDGVAVVPVRGVISRYANLFHAICGGTSVEMLARDIRTALDDPAIHAIILEIDSPGGQAAGVGELAGLIHAGSKQKPIVSYVSNLGASAGYWLASAGSEVVAAPSAILGSVGVVLPMYRTTDDGKTIEFVSSQSPDKRLSTETKDGRAKIQAMVDAMAAVFIASVAEYREITAEKVMADFGAGGVLVGQAAVDAGMADRLGSLEELISELSDGGPAENNDPFPIGGAADEGSKDSPMKFSFSKLMAAWFKGGMAEEIEVEPVAEDKAKPDAGAGMPDFAKLFAPEPAAGPSAREKELEAQLVALTKANAKAETATAEAWFATQVAASKVTPADKSELVMAYLDCSRLDALAPLSYVAADGTAKPYSRLNSFKASVENRKPNDLTKESVPTDADGAKAFLDAGGFKTLPQAAPNPTEAEAKESAEMVKAMLRATEAGASLVD